MSSAHFLYIPLVAFAGMIMGLVIGARAARNAYELELKREEERAAARARRAERKAARAKKAAQESQPEVEQAEAGD